MSRLARTLIEADNVFTPTLEVHGGHWVDIEIDITGGILESKDTGVGSVVLQRKDTLDATWIDCMVWTEASLQVVDGVTSTLAGQFVTRFYSAIGAEYRLGCAAAVQGGWDSGDILVRIQEGASYG